jgi:C-terminal processing protease CtpA/Prc
MVEEVRYDENGQLIAPPDSYARLAQQFDARNNKIEEAYYGPDEQLTVRIETHRDAEGNEIDRRVLGPSGEDFVEAVFVRRVLPGTTAASLELQPGDRLLSYDGTDVRSVEGMRAMVDARGAAIRTLVVERQGQRISFQVPRGKLGIEMVRRFVPATVDESEAGAQQSRRSAAP